MVARTRIVNVEPESDIATLLDSFDEDQVVVVRDGHRYRISRDEQDPFANYDPALVIASLKRAFGSLTGVNASELLQEMRQFRNQD